jgi:tRNA dimethylallyltransferase
MSTVTAALLLLHLHRRVMSTTAMSRRVIVLAGPTAVGKSAVAQRLSRMMDGRVELVIADSVQIYRGMDIGANKPTREEMDTIPHHMVDICDPRDNLSAGDFVNMASPLILSILERGNTPLIVGGSTMWIQWLVKGIPDAPRASEFALQETQRLIDDLQRRNQWDEAYKISVPFDARIEKLAKNDWYRLRRYLEVALTLNVDRDAPSVSLTGKRSRQILQDIEVRCFFLAEEREELYHIIDSRCDEMLLQDTAITVRRGDAIEIRKGLFGEVAQLLLNESLRPDTPVAKAIGYRQVQCIVFSCS